MWNLPTLPLKSHAYLSAYAVLSKQTQKDIAAEIAPLYRLTERESELLQLVPDGKSNGETSAGCFITEKTVKRIFPESI